MSLGTGGPVGAGAGAGAAFFGEGTEAYLRGMSFGPESFGGGKGFGDGGASCSSYMTRISLVELSVSGTS